jgi:alpha-glucosidase
MNREFFDKARPDGDYVFFIRGGYTGVQKYAPVMWTGDSNTNWERLDGLPSVIPAVASVGISGFPITATDIAGYTCLTTSSADKELFIRWAQLGAMLPVMRNHRGYEPCENWPFDGDAETLAAYKKSAVLHTALFPYIYTLVYDAAVLGWPVVRHLALHYPDDTEAAGEQYQFLLGDRILVAPVIRKKAREREVYFPPGEWLDFYTGERFVGPGRKTVPGPLDHIPLFVKAGTIVPTFDSVIDTLVKEDRDDLNGWDDANKSMKIVFYGDGADEFMLWDGTRIRCEKAKGAKLSCRVIDAPVERKYTFESR